MSVTEWSVKGAINATIMIHRGVSIAGLLTSLLVASSCVNRTNSSQRLREPALIGIGEVTAGVDPITGRPEIGTWWIAYGDTTEGPACVVLITQDSLGVRKDSEWSLSKVAYAKLADDLEEVGLFDIIRYDAIQKKQKVFNRNRWLSVRIGDRSWGYGGRPPSHFQALNTSATLLENQVFDSATALVDVAFKNATYIRELTEDQSSALPAMKLFTSSALDRENFHWPKTR